MKNIIVLNRNDFRDLMVSNKISKDNISNFKTTFIISINDSIGENSISYFEDVLSNNLLILHFDDSVDANNGEFKLFDDNDARLIISFFEKMPDDFTLIIHCTAGQNRSGSVGKFAVDFFNYDMRKFLQDNPIVKGNSLVTRTLNRIWLYSHYN